MRIRTTILVGALLVTLPLALYASSIDTNGMYHFVEGDLIDPNEVNANFDYFADTITVKGGKVGLNQASPLGELHITKSGAGVAHLMMDNKTDLRMSFYAHEGGYAAIEAMNMDNSSKRPLNLNPWGGNVGIGTTNPLTQLHVTGSIRSDASYPLVSGYSGFAYWPSLTSHVAYYKQSGAYSYYWRRSASGYPNDGTDVSLMQLNDSGDLWVSNGYRADSSGYAYLELSGAAGAYIDLKANPNADYEGRILTAGGALYISTTMPNAFYIGPATQWGSLLGIGTTAPQQKLHVVGNVYADTFLAYSDESLKKDVRPIENASEGIACLQGVTYRWKEPRVDQGVMLGLIAQEVEQCFPEVVTLNSDGLKSVAYDRLVAPLIEAVKEEQVRSGELKEAVQNLHQTLELEQSRRTSLEEKLVALEERLNRLERQGSGRR